MCLKGSSVFILMQNRLMSLWYILYEEFVQWKWIMDVVLGLLLCSENTVEATSFLPCLQKENAVSIAACTFQLQSKMSESQNRFFPRKKSFYYFNYIFVLGCGSFAVIGLSSHFDFSCLPPCQQSHFCRVKMKCEGKWFVPSLPIFSCFHVYTRADWIFTVLVCQFSAY